MCQMFCLFVFLYPCNLPGDKYHCHYFTGETVVQRDEAASAAPGSLGFSLVLISGDAGSLQSPHGYICFQRFPTLNVTQCQGSLRHTLSLSGPGPFYQKFALILPIVSDVYLSKAQEKIHPWIKSWSLCVSASITATGSPKSSSETRGKPKSRQMKKKKRPHDIKPENSGPI